MAKLVTAWGTQYYRVEGTEGPPVLFLHGTGCDSEDWRATLNHLNPPRRPARLRAVLLDFRGHGHSSTPEKPFQLRDLTNDVLFVLAHLGLDDVMIVGHSLGGMVALDAARKSDHVSGLVLLEGWSRLRAADSFQGDRFYGYLDPPSIASIQHKADTTRRRFTPEVWAHFWRSVERFDATEYLAHTSLPILEVYGSLGKGPHTQTRLQVPDRPQTAWMWVPNAGHYLPHEKPEQVASACIRGLVHMAIGETQ
jgi:pimeloyl-ACP methyl ester carboxylesterase